MFPFKSRPGLASGRTFAALLLILFSTLNLRAQNGEFRGVWVDAWGAGFVTSNQVAKLVSDCRTYNFNAVVVQMRRNGDAFYMPQTPNLEPRTTALAAGYDALAEIIRQCHSSTPRIEVHAWIKTHAVWGDPNTRPSQPSHIVNLHPEYLMENSVGSIAMGEGLYVDPGHPGVTMWNYNIAKDIVSRYAVDGLHWDYIRYPVPDSGYNPVAIERYNAEFGLTGKPSSSSAQFSNWRRRQVTDFLRWVNSDMLAINTNLMISCSVFGSLSDATNARYQDWGNWTTEGIVDFLLPMIYTSDFSIYKSRADTAFINQGVRRIYPGPGAYLNTKEGTVAQLNYARTKGFKGTAFYSYRTPNSGTVDQTGTFTHVRDNYQPTWTNTPALPWKISPTKGIIKGTVARSDNGGGFYNAAVTITGPANKNIKTDPHGKFAFFETTPGTYTVSVTPTGLGMVTTNVTITAGQIIHVDLIVSVTDTTPPAISGVIATNITDSSAVINWVTDEPADSTVIYGSGLTSYSGFIATSHTIPLTNLAPDTTYTFSVESRDTIGNVGSQTNFTFTTLSLGAVADLIIDNLEATPVGSGWITSTFAAPDRFAENYQYRTTTGSGVRYMEYTPNILVAGRYKVYEWHPAGINRTTNATFAVVDAVGINLVSGINQKVAGGVWNLIGQYDFLEGTNGSVRITDIFAKPNGDEVVVADAIKFEFVMPLPLAPSNLRAFGVAPTQVNLTWKDNATNEFYYILYRAPNALGPFTPLVTLSQNKTNYTDTDLTEGTRYYYVVQATNSSGLSPYSNQTNALTLPGLPIITKHPAGQTAPEGGTAVFNVEVRARFPQYQWQFGGVNIPGATGSSLTLTNLVATHEGDYQVVVSNQSGSVVSDFARLMMAFQVIATSTPGGTVVADPNRISYDFNEQVTVTAVPDAGGTFIGWTGDASGTNPVVTFSMDRTYRVKAHFMPTSDIIVDNPQAFRFGNWTLSTASTDKYGSSFNYTASIAGPATASAIFRPNIIYPGKYNVYAWHTAGSNRTANLPVHISYINGSLNTNVNQTINGGQWVPVTYRKDFTNGTSGYVEIWNETGESGRIVVADAFKFTLVNPAFIVAQPQGQSVSVGSTASFTIVAGGSALQYQWRLNGAPISGATNATYTIASAQFSHAGTYDVVLTTEVGSVLSQGAALTVNPLVPPTLGSATVLPGGQFRLELTADAGNYVVEASTNLVTWNVLTTLTNSSGSIQFTDTASTNLPARYYRTRRQ